MLVKLDRLLDLVLLEERVGCLQKRLELAEVEPVRLEVERMGVPLRTLLPQ